MKALKNGLLLLALLVNFSALSAARQVTPRPDVSHPRVPVKNSPSTVRTAAGKASAKTVHGTIVAVTSSDITVQIKNGSEISLLVDSSVDVYFGLKKESFDKLSTGDEVKIKYSNDNPKSIYVSGPCVKHPELPQCHH